MPVLQKVLKAFFHVDDALAQVEAAVFDEDSHLAFSRAKWIGHPSDIAQYLPGCVFDCGTVQTTPLKLKEIEAVLMSSGFEYHPRRTQWILRAYGMTLCTVEFTPGELNQVFVQINEGSTPLVDQEQAIYGNI